MGEGEKGPAGYMVSEAGNAHTREDNFPPVRAHVPLLQSSHTGRPQRSQLVLYMPVMDSGERHFWTSVYYVTFQQVPYIVALRFLLCKVELVVGACLTCWV